MGTLIRGVKQGLEGIQRAHPSSHHPLTQHAHVGAFHLRTVPSPSTHILARFCCAPQPQGAPPILSEEKSKRPELPMDFLVEQFALDPTTKWRRVYPLGGKMELLVVVRQGSLDGPVKVDFISDMPSGLMLHWGVTRPGGWSGEGGCVCVGWGAPLLGVRALHVRVGWAKVLYLWSSPGCPLNPVTSQCTRARGRARTHTPE